MMQREEVFGYAVLSVSVNLVLVLIKVVTGMAGNSYALIADGIESASDVMVSLITWVGFALSLRPPDDNHPYGHGRMESLAGMFTGVALLAAAGVIAFQSVREIQTPHHCPEWFTLPVLIAVILVKETLARRISGLLDKADSRALEGDAWHHRSDALTSAAAAIGITIALVGGKEFAQADDWGALFACGIIALNGGRIVVRSFHENMDRVVDPRVEREIRSHAGLFPGILLLEKCRVRKSGIFYFAETHLQVDPECTVRSAHELAHAFKAVVKERMPSIQDLVIHLEPHGAGEGQSTSSR